MKRKRVLGILLLSISIVTAGVTGCSKEENKTTETTEATEKQQNEQKSGANATEEEIAEASKIEIDDLKEITDWKEMAKINLGDKITIDGTGVTEKDNVITITEGGEYVLTGTLKEGSVVVNTEDDVRITLNGANLTGKNTPAIYGENSNSIYINTKKGTENTISDSGEYEDAKGSIFSNDVLVLTGNGSLTVTGNYKHAICSDDVIYMESGTVHIASAVKDGFHANDGICIDGGILTIENVNDALESEGAFVVNDGKLTINAKDDGLTTLGNMEINGGTIEILSCEEGLEAKNACVINAGTIEITANDDGINAGNELKIAGGNIFTEVARGDGLDSNGSLEISGGLTVAMGGAQPEGGIDCDQREIVITGGTLIACGGSNSAVSESESKVVSVLLGSANAGDKIGILDKDGNTVFAFETEKEYANMVLSVETIEKDGEYTVYIGGTIDGDSSYHGYYQNAAYSGGEEAISFTADSMVVSAGGSSDTGMGGGGRMRQDGEMPKGKEMPQDGERPERREMPEEEIEQQNDIL
ncbi:MAG: carbohydrate-binding domain-containing protein [Lachnospiraceae bacterium]